MSSPDTPPTEAAGDKLRLGGMALGNGLLVHGPTHWAAAVRTREGAIKVASGRKPRLHAVDGVPETVDCGPGPNDAASVDEIDETVGCETP